MKKTYQIKINQGKESKIVDVPQAGSKGQAVTIQAVKGARYQLVDAETSYGPENIRTSRQGKDLKISFEGSNTTDLVIDDYYKVSPEGYNGLIGETESGKFYEYIPENASGTASVPMLVESGSVVGMALGGSEVAPAGAAVGVLAAGLFSPWLVGAGALGAAAAAGGGGGAAKDASAPTGQTGALAAVSDSGTLGDNKTNVIKPTITGKAEANSTVEISFVDPAGKVTGPYKTTADASGNYSVLVPDNLADNAAITDTKGTLYTPVIKATDASGNSSTANGTPFLVDTKAVPLLSVKINVDANDDGLITAAEKGTEITTSATAQLDKTKVVAGDVVTFSDGTKSESVTLKDTDINNGFVTTMGWSIPAEGIASTISAVLKDLAGNVSSTVKDMVTKVIDTLKTALTIDPISSNNIISTAEGNAAKILAVTGKVSGAFAGTEDVTLVVNDKNYTGKLTKGSYSIDVNMEDLKADSDAVIEGHVTGSNGSLATASQSYLFEGQNNTKSTAIFINPIADDNMLNKSEAPAGGSQVITGKVTGRFALGDTVTLKANGVNSTGAVDEGGDYSIAVKISDLLADADTIVDATVTGTGGSSAKALQDYGVDITPMVIDSAVLSDVGQGVFTKATFGHGTLEKGTYILHVGTSIFEGALDVNQGFTKKLPSALTGVKGSDIYLEVWDTAGNYTKSGLPTDQLGNTWNLAADTQFIV
jgi:Bacterial Ig-like domain